MDSRLSKMSLALLVLCIAWLPAWADEREGKAIAVAYVGAARPQPVLAPYQDPPSADEGLAGARLGLADDQATGRLVGQSYELSTRDAGEHGALDALAKAPLIVADLPAAMLLQLADTPDAGAATILDIAAAGDELRQESCRANVLHLLPSRAMLADALMQYLVFKEWRRAFLLTGREPEDRLYAEAVRRSAKKFRVTLVADREWSFNPAAQQADTGHFQINSEVAEATRGADYDVLLVADEAGNFGDQLAHRTSRPRPVAGTQGLVATAWARVFDEYAATQLQNRFRRQAGRWMTPRDYAGWLALRAIGEAATRSGQSDPGVIGGTMRKPDFTLAGYKGTPLGFRSWDGQLRQPVLLADDRGLVSISPQPGFLHQYNELDTLGIDQPESKCRLP